MTTVLEQLRERAKALCEGANRFAIVAENERQKGIEQRRLANLTFEVFSERKATDQQLKDLLNLQRVYASQGRNEPELQVDIDNVTLNQSVLREQWLSVLEILRKNNLSVEDALELALEN